MTGVLVGAMVGAVLAYVFARYQRMNDVKLDLLRQAAPLYYRTNRAAAAYRHAVTAVQRIAPAPTDAARDRHTVLREASAHFDTCLSDFAALSDLMEQFFDPSAGKRWNRVAETYMEIWEQLGRGDAATDNEINESVGRALDEWQALVHEAAAECKRHPWKAVATSTLPMLRAAGRWARQILRGEV